MSIKNITSKEEFHQIISQGSTLVDFHAVWCGPCKMLTPILEKITTLVNDINFIKVDIDQLISIAHEFNIRSVPTVYLFQDGKAVNHFVGFKPEHQILEFINQNKR